VAGGAYLIAGPIWKLTKEAFMATGGRHSEKVKREKRAPGKMREAPREMPEENKQWDDVAEASWESFPASDPPSWTMRRPADPPKKQRHH
jgi:hypothetical protein